MISGVCGAGILAGSLKLHPERAPVWRAKCKDFNRKIKDFGCVWCWDFGELAEIAPRVGPNMEGKMLGFLRVINGCRCVRCWDFGELAEIAPRVGPSMESQMLVFLCENQWFHVFAVLRFWRTR